MAERSAIGQDDDLESRIAGAPAFVVDPSCIGCSICARIAPDCFRAAAPGDPFAVHAQPVDGAALARCREAQDNCPVEAIGSHPAAR